MEAKRYEIQAKTLFSESLIWELNRDFYNTEGIGAWREGTVPHHLTSSAIVGKTYAELIFSMLNDLSAQGQTEEKVYILELGAGHGRLGFLILHYLEQLITFSSRTLPEYCYVLSDIVEDNLQFFEEHSQFQKYLEAGILDVCFFDAGQSNSLQLRRSKTNIDTAALSQPLIVLANYFFDSIPSDLYYIQQQQLSRCSVSLDADLDISGMPPGKSLPYIDLKYYADAVDHSIYDEAELNALLEQYRTSLSNTFLFFPHIGMRCIQTLNQLSKKGIILLSMDKGFKDLHDIDNKSAPEMIIHGSMSFWVNYHALEQYCKLKGGQSLFPSFSTFHLQLGCLFFLDNGAEYKETKLAYKRFIDDFGPDDHNGFKRFAYQQVNRLTLVELIGMIRLSAFDSTFFINILPRLKQVIQKITVNERGRLKQVLDATWVTYFTLKEPYDLAFEIGGILYALGYYTEALVYFEHSVGIYGHTPDEYYNRILCHYQMREDKKFVSDLQSAKSSFPDYDRWKELDKLDLNAV